MLEGLWSGNCVMRMKMGAYSEEKKNPFPLTGARGLSLSQLCMWGWAVLENPARGLGGLVWTSWPAPLLCLSFQYSVQGGEYVCLCWTSAWNRTASISCAEAVGKSSSPTLTTHAGLVICSVVVYLLDTKSHALLFLLSSWSSKNVLQISLLYQQLLNEPLWTYHVVLFYFVNAVDMFVLVLF